MSLRVSTALQDRPCDGTKQTPSSVRVLFWHAFGLIVIFLGFVSCLFLFCLKEKEREYGVGWSTKVRRIWGESRKGEKYDQDVSFEKMT